MEESFRLIANPNKYITTVTKQSKVNTLDFKSCLEELLVKNYKIFINENTIQEIIQVINGKINELMIERIVTDIIDNCITTIEENNRKFDFVLPFD